MVLDESADAPLLHISRSDLQTVTALVKTFKRKLCQRARVERVFRVWLLQNSVPTKQIVPLLHFN